MPEEVEAVEQTEVVEQESPEAIALSDDTLIDFDGQPVSWKEYQSQNFVPKSEFTKMRQEDKQSLKSQMDEYRKQLDEQAKAYQQQLANYYQQQAGQQQQQQTPAYKKYLEQAAQQGYVSADHMEPLVSQFQQEIQGLREQNQQYLQALHLLNEARKADVQKFSPLLEQSEKQKLERTINDAAKKIGVSDGAMEFFTDYANNLYHAYEGDDLDDAFPEMLEQGWKRALAATSAHTKTEAQQAKQGIVGSGGRTSPSKPLKRDVKDAARIADQFWTDETD